MQRLPIVGVMGSGSDPWEARAVELGRVLAELEVHLLTGGGGGTMSSVSQAFFETPGRRGSVIGVLPCREGDPLCRPKPGYPNPWVEIPIVTHLPLSGAQGQDPASRNHINILSSDAVVALPGREGTQSEVMLALRYQRPLVAYLSDRSELHGLPNEVNVAATPAEVEKFLREALTIPRGNGL